MDVAVIVPTRHEAANVAVLADALCFVLGSGGLDWECVFVDDSDDSDDTPARLETIAAGDPRFRFIHRAPHERSDGLAGAVVRGLAETSSRYVAVMDADLQHPPAVLLPLLAPLVVGTADVVVGTRYREGGSPGGLAGPLRRAVSAGARSLVRGAFPLLHDVSDPLGGLFAFDRSILAGVELRPSGFKILLEILVRGRWRTVEEVPYEFAPRLGGASKAGLREGLRFLRHLGRLWVAAPGLDPVPLAGT